MMIKKRYFICFVVLVVLVFSFSLPAFSSQKIIINIEEDVTIEDKWIKLGNIAKVKGVTGEELQNINNIHLEEAAPPGYSRRLNKQLIKLILKDKGYKLNRFVLQIPQQVKVNTAFQIIEKRKIKEFVTNFIKESFVDQKADIDIRLISCPEEIKILAGNYDFKVKKKRDHYRGNYSLPLDIMVNGNYRKTVYINLDVNVYREVFVAKKTIYNGKKLNKKHFTLKRKDISSINENIITDWDNSLIKDGVLRKTISAGDILTTSYLKKPIIINWGDKVRAEVTMGGITVTTMVEARGRGKKGDYILVENIKTGKKFKAKIINRNFVRLSRN